ncbi:MAG: CHAT domain-containing protein, partial [Pseudomonadota bacterium]
TDNGWLYLTYAHGTNSRNTLRLARAKYVATADGARLDDLDADGREAWELVQSEYRASRAELAQAQAESWTLSSDDLANLGRRTSREIARLDELLDRGLALLDTVDDTEYTSDLPNAARTTLAAWQAGRSDWVVIVSSNDGIWASRTECSEANPRDRAACLVAAAEPGLMGARRVDLVLDHQLAALDWHTLPYRDGQLLDVGSVRYRSGLSETSTSFPAPGLAILVADPTGNLSAARGEIADVRERLTRKSDWRHTVLSGAQARAPDVVSALQNAALFHYAGHAEFGSRFGWDSHLKLAGDTAIGVGDALTLGAAPDVVILSGCETALRSGIDTPSMGLANAFLARGSRAVIATSRSVDDRSARAVISSFYDQWLQGNAIDDALRTAQIEVRDSYPDLDWSAFRLMTP